MREGGAVTALRLLAIVALLASGSCQRERLGRTSPPPARARESAVPKLEAGVRDCGAERNAHGAGHDPAARECFLRAYEAGVPARLVITLYTVEGDPMRYELHVRAHSALEVILDSKDRFGAFGISRWRCTSLEKERREPREMDAAERFGLRFNGCGDAGSALLIP